MIKRMKLGIVFVLLAGLVLSACQPTEPVDTPPVDDEFEYGQEATVESLEVVLLESFPLQARATVTGYTPDGCTDLDEITVDRDGDTFNLTLITRRLTGDVMCTQALVPFEESVELDIEGLEEGTYTVIAQDQEATFRLDGDNVMPRPIEEAELAFGSDAVVEELFVDVKDSIPAEVTVSLIGYLPDGCTEIHEITYTRDEQTFIINIVTIRPAGDVACIMVIVPFEESISLDVEGLPAGDYNVVLAYDEFSETFTLNE